MLPQPPAALGDQPPAAARSYNERMLQAGWVVPYFIWPNIDPFRRHGSLIDAVPQPGTANTLAEQQGGALQVARQFVRDAHAQRLGLFERADPLRLPFELRFKQRAKPSAVGAVTVVRSFLTIVFFQGPACGRQRHDRAPGNWPTAHELVVRAGCSGGRPCHANGRHPGALIYVEPAHFLL